MSQIAPLRKAIAHACYRMTFLIDIDWHPLVSFTDDDQPLDWNLQSTGLFYQSPQNNSTADPLPAWKSEPFVTTIDSGTSLILVSKPIAKAFYDQVNLQISCNTRLWYSPSDLNPKKIPHSRPASDGGEGSYSFPCDSADQLGTISIGFGDQQYAIDIRDFNTGPESE